MCSSIINLSEQGLEILDRSYENATAIILDKNDIRDMNAISFITSVQQLSVANNLLEDMHGLEKLTNITILNLAYNEISEIECLSSLAHLTWLNLCGNRIKKIENLSHNFALKHLDLSENEIEQLGDLSNLLKLKTLLLHCNRIANLKKAEEFLPQSLCILSLAENDIPTLTEFAYLAHCRSLIQLSIQGNLCAFNQIPHSRSYILALLPTLNFIDGSQPLQDERLLGEWIARCGAVHKFTGDDESALIDFLRGLNSEPPHQVEPRFRRQSETARRVTCSRAAVLKRGFTATNDTIPPDPRRSTPPRWLQRARSAQNITSTTAVAASTCLTDLANGYGNSRPSFQCQPQMLAASCNTVLAPAYSGGPHLLRSDSIFIPIDSDVELEEAEAEASVQSPKNVAQTVSVDLPADWHPHSSIGPTRSENTPVLTNTQRTHYSPQFLRSLTALSQKLESDFTPNGDIKETSPKARKPLSVPDLGNDQGSDTSPTHRLQFSHGALASLLHHRSSINGGPAINMVSERADNRSNEEASEACSPLSEHTFVVDPPLHPDGSPEGLEAKVLALRRQLEELRVLSVKQERERLRQASDIRYLAEEVRSLKAWKASVLQQLDVNHPAAGDCNQHKFHSVTEANSVAPHMVWHVHTSDVSPSLSTLAAINTSSPTDATVNVGTSTVCEVGREGGEEHEEDEGSPIDDVEDGGDEVGEFPDLRASSSDVNGTLLTANISTDSLDTRRSRLSTPMGFGTSTRLRKAEGRQLTSESILLPTDVNSSSI